MRKVHGKTASIWIIIWRKGRTKKGWQPGAGGCIGHHIGVSLSLGSFRIHNMLKASRLPLPISFSGIISTRAFVIFSQFQSVFFFPLRFFFATDGKQDKWFKSWLFISYISRNVPRTAQFTPSIWPPGTQPLANRSRINEWNLIVFY